MQGDIIVQLMKNIMSQVVYIFQEHKSKDDKCKLYIELRKSQIIRR